MKYAKQNAEGGLRRLCAALLAAALICLTCVSCGEREAVSSAAASSAAEAVSSQALSPPETVSGTESAAPEGGEDLNNPDEGESGSVVIPIETDSPEFDAKFRENPLDAAYVEESSEAVSTLDMVEVCEKYAALWETEIEAGMEKLLSLATDDREVYQKEQEDWETGLDAALKELTEQAGGGSMAQVEAAGSRMDYYRTRANAVLRALYSYDPDFTYAYDSAGSGVVSAAG